MHLLSNILRKTQASYLWLILRTSSQPSSCPNKIYRTKNQNVFQLSNEFHTSTIEYKIFGTYNPFKALDTWYELEKLKNDWDPNFNLTEFKQGATQALLTVVYFIQENRWVDLRGLIRLPLLESLQQDHAVLDKIYNTQLSEKFINGNICRVAIQEIVDRKYCDIDVSFSSNVEHPGYLYTLRFHREYTKGKLPEWTITKIIIEALENKKR